MMKREEAFGVKSDVTSDLSRQMSRRNLMAAILVATWLATPSGAAAQPLEELDRYRIKEARAGALAPEAQNRQLLPPSKSTDSTPYLGVRIVQGGLYEPSAFPAETWLEIACILDDFGVRHNSRRHGSSLFRVHALVYDRNLDKIFDTTDTSDSDEGICGVSSTIDDTFIEIPRSTARRAETVAFIASFSRGQRIEVTELVYRVPLR